MILKRMKRRHSREDAIALCTRLRRVRPDISFGADIIAGFPTESQAMFENSVKLIKDIGIAWLHVFPYSARQGTPAAKMPQVDGKLIKKRAQILRTVGAQTRDAFLRARAHGCDLALIEKCGPKGGLARLADFSPVHLPVHKIKAGQLRAVRITGYDAGNLIGELV